MKNFADKCIKPFTIPLRDAILYPYLFLTRSVTFLDASILEFFE